MSDVGLVNALRRTSGLVAKGDIRSAAATFRHQPFPQLGLAAMLGDDAAVLPAQAGQLLLACEGMHPDLVEEDPWFAGWSGVLVNLSDIAAMGGRPLALVNSVWSGDSESMISLLEGMRFACDRFGVPMVGGHSNQQSSYQALSVAVLGVADGPILSARAASPGDELWLLVNKAGRFYRHYPFWDAATHAKPERLRAQLALLPSLAAAHLVHAAKDISMGGISGTAVMFAEACGHQLILDLDAVGEPHRRLHAHVVHSWKFPDLVDLTLLPRYRLKRVLVEKDIAVFDLASIHVNHMFQVFESFTQHPRVILRVLVSKSDELRECCAIRRTQ